MATEKKCPLEGQNIMALIPFVKSYDPNFESTPSEA